jgi:hypothetical protein
MSQAFTEDFITEQLQKRYVFHHVLKMTELCYGDVVKNNEKIDDSYIPHFVQCINKMNSAVALIQSVSDQLSG